VFELITVFIIARFCAAFCISLHVCHSCSWRGIVSTRTWEIKTFPRLRKWRGGGRQDAAGRQVLQNEDVGMLDGSVGSRDQYSWVFPLATGVTGVCP
jgi:hypothetical protein